MNNNRKQKFKKVFTVSLTIGMLFSTITPNTNIVRAGETYQAKVNSNDVRLRSKPTTDTENGVSNILTEVDEGTIVTVTSMEKAPATSQCSEGWYSVTYQNYSGYICANYVSFNTTDKYDRPWTSPKKAIVGGAKFIAGSYISKGQFTSYLKKFNVNPNSYYNMFNHQYMANLAAPSSEAKRSWSTYAKNGLSDLPLSFNIPIYNDMATAYNRPSGNLIDVEKQDDITDQAFEDYLNSQEFPESYKASLRALHTKHPNWTFISMQTGVTFHEAVLAEQNVSSIQGGTQYYEVVNGGYIQTESNWYLANYDTVAYYLDPRNFLTENYILQFESLENSANYTEPVVQSVLNNTFMSDLSILDNQTYSSIFVEAGNTANVSAVYLASLAIQESGTTSKSNTTGAQFEYEGVTYSGLFNFFNIGAKSSASNPSKAGLVYASGGICTICANDGNYINVVIPLANYVTSVGYKISGSYINGFNLGENINAIKDKMQNSAISFNTQNSVIATGTTITYNDETYTAVVYGDLTGDGQINSADLLKMRQHLQGTISLSGAYFKAATLVNGNSINSADLLRLRQHLLGTNTISQF